MDILLPFFNFEPSNNNTASADERHANKMRFHALNEEVYTVNYSVVVPALELVKLGWDFDTNKSLSGVDINLSFESNESTGFELKCSWSYVADKADIEDSGDAYQSIQDVLFLMNQGVVSYKRKDDHSEDENEFKSNWIAIL